MKKELLFVMALLMSATAFTQADQEEKVVKKEKVVTVDVRKEGDLERKVKVVMKEDGENKVIEWTDNGEIPEDILKELEEAGIDIQGLEGDDEEIEMEIEVGGEEGSSYMIFSDDEDDEVIIGGEGRKRIMIMRDEDGNYSTIRPRKHKIKKHMKGADHNRIVIIGDDMELETDELDLAEGMAWAHRAGPRGIHRVPAMAPAAIPDAYMGAQIGTEEDAGVEILELIKDGPADKAGLQVGDVIMEINGANTKSVDDMMTLLRFFDPGDEVNLSVMRGEKKRNMKLTFTERPDHYK